MSDDLILEKISATRDQRTKWRKEYFYDTAWAPEAYSNTDLPFPPGLGIDIGEIKDYEKTADYCIRDDQFRIVDLNGVSVCQMRDDDSFHLRIDHKMIDKIDHDNWKNIPYSVVMTDDDDEEEVATCAVAGCEQEVVAKYGDGTFCFGCFFKAESKKLEKEKKGKKRRRTPTRGREKKKKKKPATESGDEDLSD